MLRVKQKSDRYDLIRKQNAYMPQPPQIVEQLTLNLVFGIEDVMSDLHYLKIGAAGPRV